MMYFVDRKMMINHHKTHPYLDGVVLVLPGMSLIVQLRLYGSENGVLIPVK